MLRMILVAASLVTTTAVRAQTPPSPSEIAAYEGLHRAAEAGDVGEIRRLVAAGSDVDERDPRGRTPAHVAAFASHDDALRALAEAGADMNALESQAYDVVTIAAVADDPELMSLSGHTLVAADLARRYGFTDIDGKTPRPLTIADV